MKTADHLIALECVNARNEDNGQVFLHVCAEKGKIISNVSISMKLFD